MGQFRTLVSVHSDDGDKMDAEVGFEPTHPCFRGKLTTVIYSARFGALSL